MIYAVLKKVKMIKKNKFLRLIITILRNIVNLFLGISLMAGGKYLLESKSVITFHFPLLLPNIQKAGYVSGLFICILYELVFRLLTAPLDRRRTAFENIAYQVHGITDVDITIAVSVAGT